MTLPCPAGETFAPDALGVDAFLGGRLQIAQPVSGYRAGVDPVLLAASVPARPGQSVLELGCGGGIASLCLMRRIEGLTCTGVEIQQRYAALAEHNAQRNDVHLEVVRADLNLLPGAIRSRIFDHVIANPPYYDRSRGTAAENVGREIGLGGTTPLNDWVQIAAKRLAPKGFATFIQAAARLPDLLRALQDHLGSIEVQPLAPRNGRAAHLVLVRAKKGGRADFRLHAPIVMHMGAMHDDKRKDYNPIVDAVLVDGTSLPWGAGA